MSARQTNFATSFYIVGGTVRRDALCYVQREADSKLYKGLKQGRFCYVLTSRQMGKSSLMVQTAALLREEEIAVAMLDLTAIGQNLSPEQWYGGLLIQLGQQLNLEDELSEFRQGHLELGPLQRWMQAIRQVILTRYAGSIVIFIDEIDSVRSLPFSTDEFFAGIREFYNHRTNEPELERLTFCLLGVATPSNLIHETRTTPFNIGQRIELHDFTDAEAAPLAQGLRREERLGSALIKRILHWTGGHPYLTQRLCQVVEEDLSITDPQDVDRMCEELFFVRRAREQDDNLLFVRERMLRSEVDVTGLLSLYGQVHRGRRVKDDEANPWVSILRLSGIIRIENGYLHVRNRIYKRVFNREWITANMPDAELRRQRAAYRQGLLRATTVATLIIAVIASLAFTAVKQRNRAMQQELVNRRLLYVAHMNLAMQAWESADIDRMQELVESHLPTPGAEDPRGFEWYYFWRLSHQDLLNNKGSGISVTFSPDGKRLAVGRLDGTVKLWDAATGQELTTFKGHGTILLSVGFSPDGKRLAAESDDNTVKVWDAATGQELATLKGHEKFVSSVVFSPDGKKLATGSLDHTVKVWDATSGQELVTLKDHLSNVFSMVFSSDGKRLTTGSDDGTIKLWDAATGQKLATIKGRRGMVTSAALSLDGKKLATGAYDYRVKVWDAATGQELTTLKGHRDNVTSIAFSPDGKRLATGSADRTVKLWDAATGQELATFKGHRAEVRSVVISSDGKRLATTSADRVVKMWDVPSNQEIAPLKGQVNNIFSMAFSSDGMRLAVGIGDHTMKVWNAVPDEEIATLKGQGDIVHSATFSSDGKKLAMGSTDSTVKVWDVAFGQESTIFKGRGDIILSMAFSPDDKRLATGNTDGTVKLWNAISGQELVTLQDEGAILSVAFSPDGKRLATGGSNRTVKLWDATSGQELAALKGHSNSVYSVAFSPDGKRLATGSADRTVRLWDAATGQDLATFKGHGGTVYSTVFSPDGKRLATGSADRTVKLWDPISGQDLATLKGHLDVVTSVAFSPDGKRLATGSADHIVKLWDAAMEKDVLARSKQ